MMRHPVLARSLLYSFASSLLAGCQLLPVTVSFSANAPIPAASPHERQFSIPTASAPEKTCQNSQTPHFLVFAGGGAPSYNEIALEKNVLYFQRTLQTLGLDPAAAHIFFANGNNGEATIRYLDQQRQEQFKVPEIPHLQGAATLSNLQSWVRETATTEGDRPLFFYFTGHGSRNRQDVNNNTLILWEEQHLSVQDFATLVNEFPQDTPVVTMMAQCYSGSFANFIYEGGDPTQPIALQPRCGFFATVETRPSVGCTPEVNEADYEDYSSSFFAGLSGRDRTGAAVDSADYNQDGRISYAEAHAFAKVDEEASDWPVSTAEVWLQDQISDSAQRQILTQPIREILATARPEQRYVVEALAARLQMTIDRSYAANVNTLKLPQVTDAEQEAYLMRLGMELVNISAEAQIRTTGSAEQVASLDRLLNCEDSSWAEG